MTEEAVGEGDGVKVMVGLGSGASVDSVVAAGLGAVALVAAMVAVRVAVGRSTIASTGVEGALGSRARILSQGAYAEM